MEELIVENNRINDEAQTVRQSKPISLNAFNNNKATGSARDGALKINAQTPTTSEPAEENRPTVKISSNFRKAPMRRTINDPSEINKITVDPNDIIPRQEEKIEPSAAEKAFSRLDQVVRERKEEFRNFLAAAEESDKHNRELIEAGIEEAPEEMNYLPDDVDQQVEEEIKQKEKAKEEKKKQVISQQDDGIEFDEDLFDIENDLENELSEVDEDYNVSDQNSWFDAEPEESSNITDDEADIATNEEENTSNLENSFFFDEDEEDVAGDEDKNTEESDNIFEQLPDIAEEIDKENDSEYNISNDVEEGEDPTEPQYAAQPVEEDLVQEIKEDQSSGTFQELEQQQPVSDKMAESIEKMRDADKTIKDAMDSRIVKTSNATIDNNTEDSSKFDIDEADIDDEESVKIEESDELSQDEQEALFNIGNANLKTEILAKVIQTSKKLDISSFSVSKSVISLNEAIRKAKRVDSEQDTSKRIGTWPMMAANRPFYSTPLKGSDMALMYSEENRRAGDSVITQDQAKIIYEHDANPYKPSTLKAWAKTIPFYDIDSLFAAVYSATMTGANYIPRYCTNQRCQYAFLTENLPIKDMVILDNDDTKKKFEKIRAMKPTPENSASYESVISIINDKYAVGIKAPSLYTILYELNTISEAFREKYKAVINLIQFIDYIYVIDQDSNSLEPIGWKAYVGDDSKTYKSKIATYSKILRDLTATEFGVLMSLITSMQNDVINSAILSYRIPETKCPKCGSKIEESETLARDLVFTRQRLVDIATTPSER